MTSEQRIDRDLPGILGALAAGPYPDYIDSVLATTAQRRQRPAWTFPERWIPMEISTQAAPVPVVPWRRIGVLALLAVLIAVVATAAFVGSRRALPAPYGPAANGVVGYANDADIVVHDPATGETTTIIGGPEIDTGPRFSRDGALVVFARHRVGSDPLSDVVVANIDGSDQRTITPEPMVLTINPMAAPYTFASDGASVAITGLAPGHRPAVLVAPTAANGDARWYDLSDLTTPIASVREPHFRPTDDNVVLVTADRADGFGPVVFTLDLETGATTPIVTTDRQIGLDAARWSPDGRAISYTTWDNNTFGLTVRTHIVNADGSGDRVLPAPPDMVFDIGAAWSNDASRMLLVRGSTNDWSDTRAWIVPTDGSGIGIEIPHDGPIQGGCCYAWEWSPDDSKVLGKRILPGGSLGGQVLVDVPAATISEAPWETTDDPVWQRVAP